MAIVINGKVYRNLEDQVQYLTEQYQTGKLIEELGIHVLGVYVNIEDVPSTDYQYGDAYLIGTETPYNLYVYTEIQEVGDKFIDVGVFPAVGEKGEKGDKGDTGEKGERGPKGDTGPRGYSGDKGETGATGSQGPQGLTGAKGDKGDVGPAFNIVATLESTSQLPTPTIEMQDEGKCYLIPVDGVNHVYCIQGDSAANVKWIDLGTSGIKGAKGDDGKDGVGLNSYLGFNEGTYNSTSGSVTNTGIQYQQQANITYLDETVQTVQVNNQHKIPIVADSPTSISYNTTDNAFHITTDLSSKADKTDLNNYYTKTEISNSYVAKTNYSASIKSWQGFTLEIPSQYHFSIYKVCLPGTYTLTYGTDTTELTWGIYDILVYRQTSTLKIMIAKIKNANLTYIEGQELKLSGASDNIPCIVTKY